MSGVAGFKASETFDSELGTDVTIGHLDGRAIPILVEPAGGAVDLVEWVATTSGPFDALVDSYGAVLLRGFTVDETSFERFVGLVGDGGLEYTQRSTRRTREAEGVYTSTEYPPALPIALHSENAFQAEWPQRIAFHAVVVAESGGATPIADNNAVFEALDEDVRNELIRRKIKYVRNFGGGFELPWQEAFQTESRAEVEAYCNRNAIAWSWKDGDRLKTEQTLPAAIRCPVSGLPLWFNQAHLFHVSNLTPEVRAALLEALPEDDLPRQVYFGDGEPISDEAMDRVRAAYDASTVRFDWQVGDLAVLDNRRVCHGREPFTGARKVLVSMWNPGSYDELELTYDELSAAAPMNRGS
jgi:alpha-ketoglutarate-dependent taurine dioxygenase